MATKTFSPGEYAYYPRCRISIKGDEIKVEWLGSNKSPAYDNSSAARNAVKESRTFDAKTSGNDLPVYLEEQSTHYWSETMMDWIKKNCSYKTPSMFAGGW